MLADRRGEVKGGVKGGLEGCWCHHLLIGSPLLQVSSHKNGGWCMMKYCNIFYQSYMSFTPRLMVLNVKGRFPYNFAAFKQQNCTESCLHYAWSVFHTIRPRIHIIYISPVQSWFLWSCPVFLLVSTRLMKRTKCVSLSLITYHIFGTVTRQSF